jgi:hypothetical protein
MRLALEVLLGALNPAKSHLFTKTSAAAELAVEMYSALAIDVSN